VCGSGLDWGYCAGASLRCPFCICRELMRACQFLAPQHSDPQRLLAAAHAATTAPGSCTAAVALVRRRAGSGSLAEGEGGPAIAELLLASLGDCGVHVIRQGVGVLHTEVQEHEFNMPFQLACPDFFPGATRVCWPFACSTRRQNMRAS
jgi:hypothetical protein